MKRILIAACVALLLAGCTDPGAEISEGSFRNAVATGATRELAHHGVALAGRLDCESAATTPKTVTVTCAGHTTDRAEVTVEGRVEDSDSRHPRERYTISVGGHPLTSTDCLGAACHHHRDH